MEKSIIEIVIFDEEDEVGAVQRRIVKELYINIPKPRLDPDLILGIFLSVFGHERDKFFLCDQRSFGPFEYPFFLFCQRIFFFGSF